MVVIRIETERLILRPMEPGDIDDLLELHSQPAVIEFLGPATRGMARERLERCQHNWEQGGYDLLAVLERSTGRFLGRAGVKYWPEFGETEAGWAFRREAWGHGYATEAARASVEWGFTALPVPYITAMIRPDNGRSLAVARRLGMTPIRDEVVVGIPVIVHAIEREAWGAGPPPAQVEQLMTGVAQWAQSQDDVLAVGLSGSPGTPELVFISRAPASFPDAEQWAGRLGGATVVGSTRRGTRIEHRLRTSFGLELQVTVGSVALTERGLQALYDPGGILSVTPAHGGGAAQPA